MTPEEYVPVVTGPDGRPRWLDYQRLDRLAPADWNPKLHAKADILASIARFGYTTAVEVDERTGRLVSGHGRLEALLEAAAAGLPAPDGIVADDDGTWLVPVFRGWRSVDDDEAQAYLVAANEIPAKGGWDRLELARMLEGLHERSGLAGTGYDADGLRLLLADAAKRNPDPPAVFPTVGDDIAVEYGCPRCGYEWSGSPHPDPADDG